MSGILRHSLRRIVPSFASNVNSKATVISGPPKNHLTAVDKFGLGGGMCFAILFPVGWILANVKHYKNPGGAK